ncbi:LacI family DNA-binding transcriptional regulator [Paenibacillus sp. IB182496]|uniref:LacI family DNA-binding transcriptional regulator n=1 Tax=Paenibacillus sabuli TaxID=2772509 RepID=A0A927BQH4_9BACL|nr:LacI family DNA-binding transcriptional regulator [Paenibacillus sabuli]MBD2844856.1 LacI family DNA-binding transcriptional regulator [Paenibacillus sabuli]
MPRRKAVTLQTIADELGLTIHTVSKALRGLPGMAESTRKLVIDRARALGYRTKEQEAGIAAERIPWAQTRPRRFAMLIGDSAFHRLQMEGVRLRLNELGHSLAPLLVPYELAGERELEEWLARNELFFADGLFLTAALPEWMEAALLRLELPKVLLNYPPDLAEVDSVIWDVEYAVQRAVQELQRHGHRRILYVGDIASLRGFRLRWEAFLRSARQPALQETPTSPEAHVTTSTADRAVWMEQIRQRLSEGGYTAVLSTIPDRAEWVGVAADFLGLARPRDLSLIAMENEANPHIAHVSRPLLLVREAGERAAELMLRRLANPLLPYEHVRLRGGFHAGSTLGPPRSDAD